MEAFDGAFVVREHFEHSVETRDLDEVAGQSLQAGKLELAAAGADGIQRMDQLAEAAGVHVHHLAETQDDFLSAALQRLVNRPPKARRAFPEGDPPGQRHYGDVPTVPID